LLPSALPDPALSSVNIKGSSFSAEKEGGMSPSTPRVRGTRKPSTAGSKLVVTQIPEFWNAKLKLPLIERFGPAPAELVSYVALVNSATGNPAVPAAVTAPPDLLADVQHAIGGMPAVVTNLLGDALLGVYFASGLGSSAVTDVVVAADGRVLGSVVALDLEALLERRANEWATWKENTPFAASSGRTLHACIAGPADNTRANAIQFLLLHEFGHVLTAGKQYLPDWWLPPDVIGATDDYSFLRLGWQIDADKKIVPKSGNDFAKRASVGFYGDDRLDDSDIQDIYSGLQSTSFASLYACINAYDDFAESFATYVHSVLLRRPYQVTIRTDGVVTLQSTDFWASERSAAKRAFMENMLSA
jgi:hypothetical protein